uniref:NB-ARC domain-containing protein n=1 Tax=Nymphaea colorata TaxID=210225 RepID=A0A5K0Y3J5_9MAGN
MSTFTGMLRHFSLKNRKKDSENRDTNNEESQDSELGLNAKLILCFLNPAIQKIGVWGMAGTGKTLNVTTALGTLNELKNKIFDCILFFTVKDGLRTLRNDLIRELGVIKVDSEDDDMKAAALLYRRLRGKKFLLILDDLWETISLEELGVPEPTEENGCKLLVITRNRKLCDLMGTQVDVRVSGFTEEDAWSYICEAAGDVVKQPSIEPIAKRVAKECDCLPLALKATMEAMAGRSDEVSWLRMLGDWMHFRPSRRIFEKLFLRLKLSYDHLESELLRKCFLACSLYAEKQEVNVIELIHWWIYEGYIDLTEEMTLLEAYEKGAHLIEDLRDASMIEVRDGGLIKFNDVMKDLALIIKSKEFIKKIDQKLLEAPDREAWEEAEMISLKENHITSLEQNPNCPNLTCLHLCSNHQLRKISPEFFEQMPELRFLDLSWTGIDSLPRSISHLVKLRLLDLDFCRSLRNITGVGALKQLITLDLSATPIEELPVEIGELTQLRHLHMFATVHLKRVASGILPRLCFLEILKMGGSSYAWQSEGLVGEASLQELLGLRRLDDLALVVRSVADFEFFDQSTSLQSWKDDVTIECRILETSTTMKFEGKFNKWESEFEEEDMVAKILATASSMVDKYEGFFDKA